MKKIIFLPLFVLNIIVNAQTLKPFTIEGDISSINDKIDSIHFEYATEGKKYDLAFPVNKGRFLIKGNISQPTVAVIYYFGSADTGKNKYEINANNRTWIFIQAGKMNFKAGESITDYTLKGSPYDADLKEMRRKTDDFNKKVSEADQRFMQGKDTLRGKQEFLAMLDSSRVFPVKIWIPYLDSHPQSPLVFYAIAEMMRFNHNFQGQDIAPIYDRLTPEMKNSYEGKRLKAMIATGNGSIAPEFSQADTSGVMVSLSSFRGKYVLLDFWGSWCVFCRKESPNLIKNFEEYKDKGFTIISIAADDDKNKWLEAIHKDNVGRWTHLSDLKGMKNEVSKLYYINGYPSSFLIGPDGKIIAQNLRGEDLDKKLAEIFK